LREATPFQKGVVKALRELARKLNIPNPRFRSTPGRSEFVEMRPRDWRENEIPNSLREKAVSKIFRTVPQNFSDVNHGSVRRESIALTASQWQELLGYYGIEVPMPTNEGYKILPDIDRERYRNREDEGLEGPYRANNGKVVYYDTKEGKYYDPDSDFYISFDEWEMMNEMMSLNEARSLEEIGRKLGDFFGKIKQMYGELNRPPKVSQKGLRKHRLAIKTAKGIARGVGNKVAFDKLDDLDSNLSAYVKSGSEEDLRRLMGSYEQTSPLFKPLRGDSPKRKDNRNPKEFGDRRATA
jgi:hypothetical protein